MTIVYERGGVYIDPDVSDPHVAIIHDPPVILVSLPRDAYRRACDAGVQGDTVYLPQSGLVYTINLGSSNSPATSGRG